MRSQKQTFEHFYLTKVALGDCCGCAERVIDWRDIELAALRVQAVDNPTPLSLAEKIKRWFRRNPGKHSVYVSELHPLGPFRR